MLKSTRSGLAGGQRVSLLGAVVLAACLLAPAAAQAVAGVFKIGGIDDQSTYTWDGSNGSYSFLGGDGQAGSVTTSDVDGFLGGRVLFEMGLDTNGYDATTDSLLGASFGGTAAPFELTIWDSTQTTLLLALELNFIDVEQVGFANGSSVTLGNPTETQYGISSALLVKGGTLMDNVGGLDTHAVLQVFLSKPRPRVTATNLQGFLSQNFDVGITAASGGTNWDLTIFTMPEPGTALLVGFGMLGLTSVARRTSRRRQG